MVALTAEPTTTDCAAQIGGGGEEDSQAAAAALELLSLASRAVHADDYISTHRAVAPAVHVSTTFRYSGDAATLVEGSNVDALAPHDSHVYSRESAPNTTRLEAVLTSVLGGPAVTYTSGLAAFHALLVFLNPRQIAILSGGNGDRGGLGYHGCRSVVGLVSKLSGLRQLNLDSEADLALLGPDDLVHVETPVNPTGEARDVGRYAALAREKQCYLSVDATLAPPPLQDPLALGADVVMHSGTKYLGGHSDMLCGVLAVSRRRDRDHGGPPASAPSGSTWAASWAALRAGSALRSLRTLELRVCRQSASAESLVAWLAAELGQQQQQPGGGRGAAVRAVVDQVLHASVQPDGAPSWLKTQMPHGYGPVFAIRMRSEAPRPPPARQAAPLPARHQPRRRREPDRMAHHDRQDRRQTPAARERRRRGLGGPEGRPGERLRGPGR